MAEKTLHVVPNNGSWAVKEEGQELPESTHENQQEALRAARHTLNRGDNMVVHRADGTIRENLSYEAINETESENNPSLKTRDVFSVGSRVAWSAVIAGTVVAGAVYLSLATLALAIGVTTVDHLSGNTFLISSAVVAIFSWLVSLYVGGCVASRTTAGETKSEAMIYGVLVWATFGLLMLVTGSGLGMGYGVMQKTDTKAQANIISQENAEKIGLTTEQQEKLTDLRQTAQQYQAEVTPQTAAWITFGGMILSILAAVAGAVSGAGPKLILKEQMARRVNMSRA